MIGLGCGHTPKKGFGLQSHPQCSGRETDLADAARSSRKKVEQWIEREAVVATNPEETTSSGAAIRSYPEADGTLSQSSYLYDNALALLWYTWTNREAYARGFAQTLLDEQRADGSWQYRFDLKRSGTAPGRVYNGAVAWAAYALVQFAKAFESKPAHRAARRTANYLWEGRLVAPDAAARRGLVSAGYSALDGEVHPADYAVTEHQFDAHALFAEVAPERARSLRDRILEHVWIDEDGRFSMGARSDGIDLRRALDATGAWGALWLHAIGRDEAARRSLRYVFDHFRARNVQLSGFRPYLDSRSSYDARELEEHIFVEGSLAVGLAALRLESSDSAREAIRLGTQLQCMTGGGLPYSNIEVDNFAAEPAAAPSFWFLFLEREWRTGELAPLFRPIRDPTSAAPTEHATH